MNKYVFMLQLKINNVIKYYQGNMFSLDLK